MQGQNLQAGLIPLMVLLSGDAPTLPLAEFKAVLEASDQTYHIISQEGRLLRVMTTPLASRFIHSRCAYTHMVMQELYQSPHQIEKIINQTEQIAFRSMISPKDHFAVRIKAIDGAHSIGLTPTLESQIGKTIVDQTNNKVQLTKPDTTFYGIFTKGTFYFGVLLTKTQRDIIAQQKPSTRAFFKPSSMNPLLARVLANLLRIRPQTIIVDPFCGTGGLLLEAFDLGARIIAIELDTKTVAGAKQNLRRQGHVIKGDARQLPLRLIDGILTDPPYGRSASTKGVPLPELIKVFLSDAADRLLPNRLVCISFPMHFPFQRLLSTSKFDCLEEHSVFVHSSLTRRIYLLRRRME